MNTHIIAYDLDETLVFVDMNEPWGDSSAFSFTVKGDPRTFSCKPRPEVKELFQMNAFFKQIILTNGNRDYAETIIANLEWPFKSEDIYTVEDQLQNRELPYGEVILIDNLYFKNNQAKANYAKVNPKNYLQVPEYRGEDRDDNFNAIVQNFINSRTT